MKAKKGQILVLVLMLMAVGLIVMTPLLQYMNTSYNIYADKLNETMAYYTVDAMMGKIFSDMYAGENVYALNTSNSSRYNPTGEWLNGFKISTFINDSMSSPPAPSAANAEPRWVYNDPGCAFGLSTLAYNGIYPFPVYLTGGTSVKVNWYFNDVVSRVACNYYCIGRMWITNSTATVCGSSSVNLMNGVSQPFQQQLDWTVPQNGSGNYYINFQNLAQRGTTASGCPNTTRSMSDFSTTTTPPGRPTFSGVGDLDHTWVRLGNSSGGQSYIFQDYTIISTARLASTNQVIASVTACVRQTPGSLAWMDPQRLVVVSWIVNYH